MKRKRDDNHNKKNGNGLFRTIKSRILLPVMKRKRKDNPDNRNGIGFLRSIKSRILLSVLILFILAVSAVATVSYHSSAQNTTTELTNNVVSQMEAMNGTFDLFFSNIESIVERFSDNELILNYTDDEFDELLEYMAETQETTEEITTIYVAFDDTGEVVHYPDANLGHYNPKEWEWYQNAIESNEVVWTEPFIDVSTGEIAVAASKAYRDASDTLIGVIGMNITVNTLTDMMSGLSIGNTGYGFILDSTGKVVVHPDGSPAGEDQSQNEFYQDMTNAGDQGIIEYENNGEKLIIAFQKNPTTGWILGGAVNVKEFEEKAAKIMIPIAITLVLAVLSSFIIIYSITNPITSRIKAVMERMKQIATGDFSNGPFNVKAKDETGQLMLAVNEMTEKIRELLQQARHVTESVTGQSEELTQSSNEVMRSTEQVAATMQEIAAGTESQAKHATNLSSKMEVFTEKVENANENGSSIQHSSQDVLTMTNRGAQLMDESTKQMTTIDHIVQDAVKKVEGLDKHTQQISELVSVIEDIAEQTNLLALNAAIEAARAGEHGKGFAVVAEEVKNLSEQSAQSVSNITEIVSRIQNESTSVVASLKEGYKDVAEGSRRILNTEETFEQIRKAVIEMGEKIKDVVNNLYDIQENNDEMNKSIQEIAAVSEEAAGSVEEISASTEQVNSAMEEVASSSEDLTTLAEQLNHVINQFKL